MTHTSIFVRRWLVLLLALCSWAANPVLAQTLVQNGKPQAILPQERKPFNCGTPDLSPARTKSFAGYIKRAEATRRQTRIAATGITYLGIKPWLVSGSTSWSTSTIVYLMNRLNNDYENTGIQFYMVSGGVGTITAVSSTTLTYPANEATLLANHFDATAINVYFGDYLVSCSANSCKEIGGLSPSLYDLNTLTDRPTDITNPNVQAKKDDYILIGNAYDDVLSHEVGHYFGLLHTFNGSNAANCQDRERPNLGDTDRGDLIADTNADPFLLYPATTQPFNQTTCVYSGTLVHCATNQAFNPPVTNTMSYWDSNLCPKTFTLNQRSRIQLFLTPRQNVNNLYQPQNGVEGVTVGPVVSLSVVGSDRRIGVTAVAGALGYIFEGSVNDASFANPLVIDYTSQTGDVTFQDLGAPPANTTYYYRVRATNSKTYSRILSYPCTVPTATLSGSQTISNGQSATYTVALTGTPPWDVQVGGTAYTNVTTSPLRVVTAPFQALQQTYTQTTSGGSVTNACGTAPLSGTASVTVLGTCPTVSVTLTYGNIGCGNTTAGGSILISPSGYAAHWRNTTTGTDYPGAGTFASNLTAGDYTIDLTGPNGCTGPQQRFTIRDYGPNGSTAVLSGPTNNRIPKGQQTSIRVQLTGTAPWSVTYVGRGGRQSVESNITTASYDIGVLPDSTTTYRLVAVSGQCSTSAVSGSATLIVVPVLTNLEYFFDTEPGVGHATSIAVGFNQTTFDQTVAVPVPNLSAGMHTLFMRGKDGNGYWGEVMAQSFIVLGAETAGNVIITQLEYYVDTDPGVGQATQLAYAPTPGAALSLSLNAGGLSAGTHTLVVRAKSSRNRWSISYVRSFVVILQANGISRIEYFFDATDPGPGSGKPIAFSPPNSVSVTAQGSASVSGLAQGAHTINVRAQAGGLIWSPTQVASFTVTPCTAPLATLYGNQTATTDQLTSFSVGLGGSAPFSVTANGQVQTDVQTNTAYFTIALTTPGTYTLTPQSLSLAVANGCGAGQVSGQIVVTVVQGTGCTAMQTVRAGSWDDPTIWSCGRLPIATDAVVVRHAVAVPIAYMAHAKKISFDTSGRLNWGTSAKLSLGL